MATKKEYLNLIRWSCVIDSFTNYYFIIIIVLYLLRQGVTPWIAVSVPVVLEFARLISRGIKPLAEFALKIDYKKYHIFHLITFLLLGIVISQCKSIYTIYFFTLLSGTLTGIKFSTITKMNTQCPEHEPYCFMEEERSVVVGGTVGLIVSQFLFDLDPKIYIFGYIVIGIVGIVLSILLKKIKNVEKVERVTEDETVCKQSDGQTILVTSLFAILVSFWTMGGSGFSELAPLISTKVGYLNAVYTVLEIILLCLISGKILSNISRRKKLLLSESIIACIDVLCLFIAAVTLSWKGLLVAYILEAFTSTMGDPIWGSIMSAYSTNNRKKWVLVNRVYFIIRGIFCIISWYICRECVIRGVESFKILAIVLIALIIIFYLISDKINKKVFGDSI